MSSADRVKFYIVEEVTPGTTPTSAAMKALRIASDSLKVMYQNEASKELDDNRAEREQVQVGRSQGGDLSGELSYDLSLLQLLAASMASAWSTPGTAVGTVDNGSTLRYFSVLKQFADLTAINHLFKGLLVNNMSMSIKKKAMIDLKFGLMGLDFSNGAIGTVLGGTPTYAAKTETDPMNGSSNVTSLLLDSVPFTSCLESMTINVNNNAKPTECVGSLGPTAFTLGKFQLSGDMNLYFKDETIFNKYKNGQPFTLDFTLTDAGASTLALAVPRAKFDDCEVVAGGTGQDVVAKCKWRAIYDPVTARVARWTSTA